MQNHLNSSWIDAGIFIEETRHQRGSDSNCECKYELFSREEKIVGENWRLCNDIQIGRTDMYGINDFANPRMFSTDEDTKL